MINESAQTKNCSPVIDFSFGADSFLYMLFSQKHLKTACFLLSNILKPIRQKNTRTKKQDNFHEKDMSFCSYVLSSSTCKRIFYDGRSCRKGINTRRRNSSSAVVMPSVLAVMVVVTAMSFVSAIPALAAFFVLRHPAHSEQSVLHVQSLHVQSLQQHSILSLLSFLSLLFSCAA